MDATLSTHCIAPASRHHTCLDGGHNDANWPRLFSPTACSASRKDHDVMTKVRPTGDAWTSRTPRSFLLQSSSGFGAGVVSCVEFVDL
ncbi:hypothetical protein B0H10DRAFT_2217425 [Mycena sp. CBHHK59/15]|nr:hypothetical protein B0H10DRAFT_2217425 [Mycena sp. CBHHK59/15]